MTGGGWLGDIRTTPGDRPRVRSGRTRMECRQGGYVMVDDRSAGPETSVRLVVLVPLSAPQLDRLRTRFTGVEIVMPNERDKPNALSRADAVVAWDLSSTELAAAPRLRWLHTGGAGVDPDLLTRVSDHGAVLTNNSGVHAINIGEHVLGLMLTFARRLHLLVRHQQRHEWHDDAIRRDVFELDGQVVLILGTGDLGLGVAHRAAAMGMRV